ncbi:MAG: sensor histidine kinase [Pseudomonadota bacterium]
MAVHRLHSRVGECHERDGARGPREGEIAGVRVSPMAARRAWRETGVFAMEIILHELVSNWIAMESSPGTYGEPTMGRIPRPELVAREAVHLHTFLSSALDSSLDRLGWADGVVYLLDGATGRLERACQHGPRWYQKTLDPADPRAVGALAGGTWPVVPGGLAWLFHGGEEPPAGWTLRTIRVGRKPAAALFCFLGPATEADRDPSTADRARLRLGLQKPSFLDALQRMRVRQALRDIHSASQTPGFLRDRACAYLIDFLARFENAEERPDFVALQLVDWRRESIRTIQAVGAPLSFRTIPARPLDGPDIQAFIVKERQAEIIVGFDDSRFKTRVFKRFFHGDLVRLWIPLFPLDMELHQQTRGEDIQAILQRHLTWTSSEASNNDYSSMIGRFSDAVRAPAELVYGTLEIGYRRSNPERLEFEKLTTELATRCIANAYACAQPSREGDPLGKDVRRLDLHITSLPGALERIARAAATPGITDGVKLTCYRRRGKKRVSWTFPCAGRWPAAIPEETDHPVGDIQGLPAADLIRARNGVGEESLELIEQICIASVHTAFRLEEAATKPYELSNEDETKDPVGTLGSDDAAQYVCEAARRDTGADRAFLTMFEHGQERREGPETQSWALRVPVRAGEHPSPEWTRLSEREEELARRVLKRQAPLYPTLEDPHHAILPLNLLDGTLAVIVLSFDREREIQPATQLSIESHVAEWCHRLSLHRLLLANRFTALMARIRDSLAEALNEAQGDIERPIERYVEQSLSTICRSIQAQAVLLTTHHTSPSNQPRTERSWCLPIIESESETTRYEVFSAEAFGPLEYPCQKCLERGEALAFTSHDSPEDRQDICGIVMDRLNRVATEPAAIEPRKRVAKLFDSEASPGGWTVLVVPVVLGKANSSAPRSILTVVIPGVHQLRTPHRKAVTEIGRIIGVGLSRTRKLAEERLAQRHLDAVDALGTKFAKAESSADVASCLLEALLASPGAGTEDPTVSWDIADNAVIWVVDQRSGELTAQYGSPVLMASLRVRRRLRVPLEDHPLRHREGYQVVGQREKHRRFLAQREACATVSSLEGSAPALLADYRHVDTAGWIVSFPVVSNDGTVFGIVDCLRQHPLRAVEERVLLSALRRLGERVSLAVQQGQLRTVMRLGTMLFTSSRQRLECVEHTSITEVVVEQLRLATGAERVDLFLEKRGAQVLCASSSRQGAVSIPQKDWGDWEFRGASLMKTPDRQRQSWIFAAGAEIPGWVPAPGESEVKLAAHLSGDEARERLAVELDAESDEGGSTQGLLYLVAPSGEDGGPPAPGTSFQRCELFTAEDARLARHLAAESERVLQVLSLVDQQLLIFGALVHSLAQPLQVYEWASNNYVRLLCERGRWDDKAKDVRGTATSARESFHALRDKLSRFANMHVDPTTRFEPTDFPLLVKLCCDQMKPQVEARGNQIDLEREAMSALPIETTWMRVALVNLLENAIKYSFARLPIRVRLFERGGVVTLIIQNSGIGIPPRDLRRIFSPYFRSEVPDEVRRRTGSGIGLALVKKAIRRIHEGEVVASSIPRPPRPGDQEDSDRPVLHDTTFTITLVRARLEAKLTQAHPVRRDR